MGFRVVMRSGQQIGLETQVVRDHRHYTGLDHQEIHFQSGSLKGLSIQPWEGR